MKIEIWISVLALIISIISILIAYGSYSISNKSYLLNLEPQLIVDTDIQYWNDKYELILLNDGPNTIHDIRIKEFSRLYDNNKDIDLMSTYMLKKIDAKDWFRIDKMVPDQKQLIPIKREELENTFNMTIFCKEEGEQKKNNNSAMNYDCENVTPIHWFLITYRTKPGKKIYKIRKYLSLGRTNKNELYAHDLDRLPFRAIIKMKTELAKIDSEFGQ